ncbi:MAG: hypothetical protein R3B49_05280 [Phycisphaerales bacterium]
MTIPARLGVEALSYLEGKSMTALLNAEKRATEYALVESQRPNFTIKFPAIDEHHVGEFIAALRDRDGLRRADAQHRRLRPAGRGDGQRRRLG